MNYNTIPTSTIDTRFAAIQSSMDENTRHLQALDKMASKLSSENDLGKLKELLLNLVTTYQLIKVY